MTLDLVLQLVFGVVGGLGIFLLGMKNMSQGMQAVAGNRLRRLISAVTNNRLMAVGVGTLVTCIVQSSSVTTVMVVGFVNSELMLLSQAIGVIMGANIGTTITGWILVLNVGKYGLPMLGLAAFGYLFIRGDRLRYLAMAVMGIGMVFFGLELMKDACTVIRQLPAFEAWFQRFQADSYIGMFKCLTVGCVLTMIVQSSSAMLGITIALAINGTIEYQTAAALVLGENIGTTITAVLASLGATTNARRAAYFHVLFNMFGVAWISLIFFHYVKFIPWLVAADVTRMETMEGNQTFPEVTRAIAATHSVFNILNTIVFLPLAGAAGTFLCRLVPSPPEKEKHHLTSLDVRMLETPMLAIEQSRGEIVRMGEGCGKMMDWLKELIQQEQPDPALVEKLFNREEILDNVQDEVTAFMTDLLSGNMPHSIVEEGRRQLRMADEYESVSDYIRSVLKFHLKLLKQGHRFDEQQLQGLLDLHDMVADYLQLINVAFEQREPQQAVLAKPAGLKINQRVKALRNRHLEALTAQKVEPHVSVAYTATLNSYRRVRDHVKNIADALAAEK